MATNLTDRERQVLELLGEGLSNSDIADKLNIAERTVEIYVRNVFLKLHVKNRTQAAVMWATGVVAK
jgi:DNA-binding NarL/FixJ family response regulator